MGLEGLAEIKSVPANSSDFCLLPTLVLSFILDISSRVVSGTPNSRSISWHRDDTKTRPSQVGDAGALLNLNIVSGKLWAFVANSPALPGQPDVFSNAFWTLSMRPLT